MRNILNITNGGSAVEIMKQANIPGVLLPWQDVLHDGPIPSNLSLEELSKIRSQFIVDRNWGDPENFTQRDNELKSFNEYEKVILWFEHDLYDQLQIIQILDWIYQNPSKGIELSIICTDQYLGQLTPEEMGGLMQYEEPITESHLKLSNKAWSALRSSSPDKWYELLNMDTTVLPFLEGAVVRLLEEYPSCTNGLSRTAEQALKLVSNGATHPGRVFFRNQKLEERVFMGDASFWVVILKLLESNPPLIVLPEGKEFTLPIPKPFPRDLELSITSAGIDVLAGKLNWLEVSNIDRWIGGVHLTPTNIWCWNASSRTIAKRA